QVRPGRRGAPKSVPVRTTTSLSGIASRRRPAGTSGAQSSRIGDESTRCDMQARLLTSGPLPRIAREPTNNLQAFKTIERCSSCRRIVRRGGSRILPAEMGPRSLLLVAAWLAFASPLEAREVPLGYDGYSLLSRVISIGAVSNVEPAPYRADVTLRRTGLLSAFGRWESTATAKGAVDGAFLRPAFYGASSAFRDRRQRVALE